MAFMSQWQEGVKSVRYVALIVRFGSLAALFDIGSSMSAFGRKPDTRQLDFESPRLTVRFHQERPFNLSYFHQYDSPLSARSGHKSHLLVHCRWLAVNVPYAPRRAHGSTTTRLRRGRAVHFRHLFSRGTHYVLDAGRCIYHGL